VKAVASLVRSAGPGASVISVSLSTLANLIVAFAAVSIQ
jgi:hypothetical protein